MMLLLLPSKHLIRHLWCLTEEMSPLSLFSDKVSDHDKAKIAKLILKNIKENCEHDAFHNFLF